MSSARPVSLLDPDLYAGNPYPTYAWLREHAQTHLDRATVIRGGRALIHSAS